jgi:hypothetical protein
MGTPATVVAKIGERSFNLVFKFGTIRAVEAELGRPITQELATGDIGLDMLSGLFWAVLQPSLAITREGSDDLIDEAGIEVVTQWMTEGLIRYFSGDVVAEAALGNASAAKKGK